MKNVILIVENDKDLSRLLTMHLQSKGYSTLAVDSIKEAELLLSNPGLTLMLIDNHLEDGLAIDHVEHFKSCSPGTPIVMMTADYIQDIRKSTQFKSLDGILLKPFTPASLNEILPAIA